MKAKSTSNLFDLYFSCSRYIVSDNISVNQSKHEQTIYIVKTDNFKTTTSIKFKLYPFKTHIVAHSSVSLQYFWP